VQTTEPWTPDRGRQSPEFSDSENERSTSEIQTPKASKRLSRREREKDEELRQNIRKEIEEELKALRDPVPDGPLSPTYIPQNFPARTLTNEELNAVTASDEFMDFIERSSKVIERALDQEYDVLADYALGGTNGVGEDEAGFGPPGKARRKLREVIQFYDERWSKKRMISALNFSPKAWHSF
jgi:dynein intermediate chain